MTQGYKAVMSFSAYNVNNLDGGEDTILRVPVFYIAVMAYMLWDDTSYLVVLEIA